PHVVLRPLARGRRPRTRHRDPRGRRYRPCACRGLRADDRPPARARAGGDFLRTERVPDLSRLAPAGGRRAAPHPRRAPGPRHRQRLPHRESRAAGPARRPRTSGVLTRGSVASAAQKSRPTSPRVGGNKKAAAHWGPASLWVSGRIALPANATCVGPSLPPSSADRSSFWEGAPMRSELDAVLRSSIGRRAFLKYLAIAGGTGVLAACQKNITSAKQGGGASASATRPPLESEPGVLHAYEWAGYEVKPLWRAYAAKGYPDPKFSFFTNTEQALAKTAGGYTWDIVHPEVGYVQDYFNLGAVQPWDTSLISNFPDLNPALEKAGQLDGKQYEIVTDWGYSGVIIRTDHADPSINSYSY